MFNKQGIDIDATALSLMVKMSGGFPMLMHEVGDAIFWQDTDNYIDEGDTLEGITEAARVVGKKYIAPQVYKLLRSETYASILHVIQKKAPLGGVFERQQILQELPAKEQKNLDNFLQRSRNLGIIDAGEAWGEYKFLNPLHQLYIWYEGKNKKE